MMFTFPIPNKWGHLNDDDDEDEDEEQEEQEQVGTCLSALFPTFCLTFLPSLCCMADLLSQGHDV